jgi:hypothetical protein
MFWFAASKFKEMTVYIVPVAVAVGDEAVNEALGEPIEPSLATQAQMNLQNDSGTCTMRIPLSGAKAKATMDVKASKVGDKWVYQSVIVTVEGTGQQIDLTAAVNEVGDQSMTPEEPAPMEEKTE